MNLINSYFIFMLLRYECLINKIAHCVKIIFPGLRLNVNDGTMTLSAKEKENFVFNSYCG